MKRIKYIFVLGLGALTINNTLATDQGSGTVTFKGSIIDAPCSISPDTANQTVDLGQISSAAIEAGTTTPVPFQLKLENCTLTDENTVTVTFNGTPNYYDSTVLGLSGTGGNDTAVGIVLGDQSGQKIALGSPSAAQQLQNGANTLQFSAWLDDITRGWDIITPGDFSSVANFTMNYQ